ncbi:hypothetical protein BDV10DRAFT_167121 [Aspergillus recurvatus]
MEAASSLPELPTPRPPIPTQQHSHIRILDFQIGAVFPKHTNPRGVKHGGSYVPKNHLQDHGARAPAVPTLTNGPDHKPGGRISNTSGYNDAFILERQKPWMGVLDGQAVDSMERVMFLGL